MLTFSIIQLILFLHSVSCDLIPVVKDVKQLRVRRMHKGKTCGPGDLVVRCKSDVDYNYSIRWWRLGEDFPEFEVVTFDHDVTKSEASGYCPQGTNLAVITDALALDEAASYLFSSVYRDTKYWVDVTTDLANVDSFLLEEISCTCFNNAFDIKSEESTIMEVKRDEYKIKKKRSTDRGMMRGVICQKEEATMTKPPHPSTPSATLSASGSPSQTPTENQSGDVIPTDTLTTQKSFDWIIFLLSIIAITLILGLLVGCVICCKIKSKNRKTSVNQTVVCAVQPNSKELVVTTIPTAPPAYDSSEYQGLMQPPHLTKTPEVETKNGIPQGVYNSYEVPMENPHVGSRQYQQPAGLYNGSTGYMDLDDANPNNSTEYVYDELQYNLPQGDYSYPYADRKSIAEDL